MCEKFNQILEDFLWSWVHERRPSILHREGQDNHSGLPDWAEMCSGDPVPDWLNERHCEDECDDYCQCNLWVGVDSTIPVNCTPICGSLTRGQV